MLITSSIVQLCKGLVTCSKHTKFQRAVGNRCWAMDIDSFQESQVFSCKTVEMLFINILEKSQLWNGREPCPLILLRWFKVLILQYKGQLEQCYAWFGRWMLLPVTASFVKGAKTEKIGKLVKKRQIPKSKCCRPWCQQSTEVLQIDFSLWFYRSKANLFVVKLVIVGIDIIKSLRSPMLWKKPWHRWNDQFNVMTKSELGINVILLTYKVSR